ncbi:MAG: metalloregulator ArsR/SmtB family transcription factor [Pseudomonadota bacterium]
MQTNRAAPSSGDVFHAVADANRRKLLDLLSDGERPVQDLVPHFDMTFQAVSQHLHILAEAGLVTRRKQGRYRYYRAQPAGLQDVHDWTGRYRAFWENRLERLGSVLDET